jgi:hypothetical protein
MDNIGLDKFGPALRWMSYEAIVHGLRMNHFQGKWEQPQYKSSMTRVWKLFEYIPFKRLVYELEQGEQVKPGKQGKETTQRW